MRSWEIISFIYTLSDGIITVYKKVENGEKYGYITRSNLMADHGGAP